MSLEQENGEQRNWEAVNHFAAFLLLCSQSSPKKNSYRDPEAHSNMTEVACRLDDLHK